MSEQAELFEEPEPERKWKTRADYPRTYGAVRRIDPETSKAAAKEVRANELELVFLACLRRHGPSTAEEVTDLTGRPIDSITPRGAPLKRKGLIRWNGEKRPGASGSNREVLELTDLGRKILREYDIT